jgi:hypothetical protein
MNDTLEQFIARLQVRVADPTRRLDESTPAKPLRPPAKPDAIQLVESTIGFPIPTMLARLYTEVADGGFGPGYGLLPLLDSKGSAAHPNRQVGDDDETIASVYLDVRPPSWPDQILPLWNWGDAIWSCLDARVDNGPIITHDGVDGPTVTNFTLRSWLEAWMDGVNLWDEIYQDKEAWVTNPFTKQPMKTKVRGSARGQRLVI